MCIFFAELLNALCCPACGPVVIKIARCYRNPQIMFEGGTDLRYGMPYSQGAPEDTMAPRILYRSVFTTSRMHMKLVTLLSLQFVVLITVSLSGPAVSFTQSNEKQGKQSPTNTSQGIGPSFKGPLGLQLYSLRAEFAKDVPGTLAKVREMGFREVEMGGTYGLTPQQFRAELDKAGLRAVSLGASFDSLRDNIDAVISNAKTFGVQYVMCAWITHQRPFSEEAARQAIPVFNRAGEKLKAAGITFAYHIHGYEFHPHGNGTLFDLLATELKPEFVSFELDVWAFHGGQDP